MRNEGSYTPQQFEDEVYKIIRGREFGKIKAISKQR